jgi:hypothetical protein
MLLECTGTRRRHDCHCAAYGPSVDGTLEPAHGGGRTVDHYAATLEAALVRAQDVRHDASTGAGFARTAVNSVALLATPPHVGKQCGTPVNCSILGL